MSTISNIAEILVSDEIKQSVDAFLQAHPDAKQIAEVEKQILERKMEVIDLEASLTVLQRKRPEINIPYRSSILWCLDVDKNNPHYFLKSKEGLVKCVEYKYRIKLNAKQNNSFGGTLTIMFQNNLVGRIKYLDMYFYGLIDFFNKDKNGHFTILKKNHEKSLPLLRQVNR